VRIEPQRMLTCMLHPQSQVASVDMATALGADMDASQTPTAAACGTVGLVAAGASASRCGLWSLAGLVRVRTP
jgi:hypothetical protein